MNNSDVLLLLCAMAQLSHDQSYLVGQWLDPTTLDLVPRDEIVRDFCAQCLVKTVKLMYGINTEDDVTQEFNNANDTSLSLSEVGLILCLGQFERDIVFDWDCYVFQMCIPITHMFVGASNIKKAKWISSDYAFVTHPTFLTRYKNENVLCVKKKDYSRSILLRLDNPTLRKEMVLSSYLYVTINMLRLSHDDLMDMVGWNFTTKLILETVDDENGMSHLCLRLDNRSGSGNIQFLSDLEDDGKFYQQDHQLTYPFISMTLGLYSIMLSHVNCELLLPVERTVYFYHTVISYDHPSLLFMPLLPYSCGNGYKVGDVVSLISSFVLNNNWLDLSLNRCYDDSVVVDLFTTLAVIMQKCDKEITTGATFVAKVLGLGLGDDGVTGKPFYPMKLNVRDSCDKFRALSGYGVYNPDYEIACWAARSRN